MKQLNNMDKAFLIVFAILYTAVAFVSTFHAVQFFAIANALWIAIILAISFEAGQASVLFYMLSGNHKKIMPWVLMTMLTAVQVIGNVYSSYKGMLLGDGVSNLQYFTKSVLFFVQSPNPDMNYVMISYITGAILPIVALCMTGMVAGILNRSSNVHQEAPPTHSNIKVYK